jgi:hypothetical protein
MNIAGSLLTVMLILVMAAAEADALTQGDLWRDFASKVAVGSELNVRLRDGQRFRATLIGTREDAVLLQPKTRVPVDVQPVPYEEIASLERHRQGGGGPGKAAAIGVASGAGTFFGILLILLAALD